MSISTLIATLADYEKQRAAVHEHSVYRRTCPGCAGTGIAGQDVDGIWRGGGICPRCGGISYIEFTVVPKKEV